jgi:hypothetical protein
MGDFSRGRDPGSTEDVLTSPNVYDVRGCIQRFPDWPPGARTANGTALCH